MNKKLLFATALVFLFVVVALVWYFLYAKPVVTPSLSGTNDPLLKNQLPPRFQFIGNEDGEESTSVTEVTQTPEDPLIRVWDRPATGLRYVVDEVLLEESATSTQGTTTVEVTKLVRATTTILLFVDRETGYVYGYSPKDNSVFQITNTIISGVYDAYVFNNGKRVIMRYTEADSPTIIAVVATIPTFTQGGSPSPLEKIEYLNSEVISVAVDEKGENASYAVRTDTGVSFYTTSSGEPSLITTSPFGEWVLSYGGSSLYATTRASAYATGVTVSLPSFATVIGERAALMLQPSNSLMVGSVWVKGGVTSFLASRTGSRNLSLKTLASKCGWGSNGFLLCATPKTFPLGSMYLPDTWFQGTVRFEDTLTQIDTETFTETPFFSFESQYGLFDVASLLVSKENNFISFINKRNGELWIIKRDLLSSGE